MSLMK